MTRVVLGIPPLPVTERYIDNPAFAFLPPLMWAAAVSDRFALRVDNAFLSGAPLLRTPTGWLLGGEPQAFWSRLAAADCDDLVIAWSSYHRRIDPAGDTLPPADHPLFAGRRVHLAEFYHGEARYEPLSHRAIGANRPFASRVFEDADQALGLSLGLPATAGDSSLRPAWVTPATVKAMATLDPVIRTGAAEGSVESHPAGRGLRGDGKFWPLMTSLGCSYRCLFCHKPGQASHWRPRPQLSVRRDIDLLAKAGVGLVFILDPIANFDAAHFTGVLDALASRGLQALFPNGLALAHLTPPLLERLRRVSSDLVVSVESGSVRSLATLRKPVDLAQAETVLAAASALGFNTSAHFMVGVPGESSADVAATLKLAMRLHDDYGVVPSIQRYVPPGQTDHGVFDPASASFSLPSSVASPMDDASPVSLDTAGLWVRENARSKATPKLIINVSYACNNHCSFCAVADRPRLHGLIDEQLRLLREGQAQGIRHLDLDGGEPTLYPGLPVLLQAANELGYERINVTTNGRRLCYPEFVGKLARIRNLEVCVSLHGPDAQTHDTLTRVAGSFHQTLTGLWNASRAGLDVALNVTVVAANVHRVLETVALGVRAGAKRVSIQRYTPFGAPDASFEPPLDVLLEQIALVRAQLPGLTLNLVNFCACEVGPFAAFAAGDQAKAVRTMQFVDLREIPLAEWLAERRHHLPECEPCHLRGLCPGKWVQGEVPSNASDELIDFTPGLQCSMKCRFCAVPAGQGAEDFGTEAAMQMLERLSPRRPGHLRFSGGEPTEREDLPALVSRARELGYVGISVQSHGLRFADPAYLDLLAASGVSEVRISVFGASNEEYEAATGVVGGFDRVMGAVDRCVEKFGGASVGVDALALRPFLPRLSETVARFAKLGVGDVLVWLPAYEGRAAAPGGEELVPTLREAAAPFQKALALSDTLAGLRVRTIYAPLCILGEHYERTFDVRKANVLIVNPGMILPMSRCAVDLGMFPPRCAPCALKDKCLGLRPSYFARHGDAEVEPVKGS